MDDEEEETRAADASAAGASAANADAEVPAATDEPVLEIVVSDPVKQGEGVNSYVSYRVSTKTNLPQYQFTQFSVIRRFSDFVWLHGKLCERNPGLVLPPLPEKNIATKVFVMSAEFVEARCAALGTFMRRLATHPDLRFSPELQIFLEGSDASWSDQVENGAESFKQRNVVQLFKEMQHSTQKLLSGKFSSDDPEFEKFKDYVVTLESYLADLHRQAEAYLRRQRKSAIELSSFSEALGGLGRCETGPLQQTFAQVATRAERVAHQTVQQAQAQADVVNARLSESVRYLASVRAVMMDRAAVLLTWETLKSEVTQREQKLEKVRAMGSKQEKVDEASKELSESTRKAERAKEEYQALVTRMEAELRRFQTERARETRETLKDFAVAQARLASDTAAAWRTILPEIDTDAPAGSHLGSTVDGVVGSSSAAPAADA